jgi:hypothetical protein
VQSCRGGHKKIDKGSGTFTGKELNWDKDFKAKGFTYYEFTGTYTLPSQ